MVLISALKKIIPNSLLRKRNRRQLKNFHEAWEESGKPFPVPHLVKRFTLLTAQERFGLEILVETGTYKGMMVEAMLIHFKKIISIELGTELFLDAKKKFSNYPQVTILNGDSGKILPVVIENLTSPSLFWLDGHYSGGETALGEVETPIVKELQSILSSKHNHVIVIDDVGDFNGTKNYPTTEELKNIVLQIRTDYYFIEKDNMIILHKIK